jgi:uncharacterized delta-60 repeat protein
VQTDFTAPGDSADQIPLAVTPYGTDGRFVATGWRDIEEDSDFTASVIAMYKANGSLDNTFGDDGKTTSDLFSGDDQFREVFVRADERIITVGDGEVVENDQLLDSTVFAAMFDPDGTSFDAFGAGGVIEYPMDGFQRVEAAAIAPDGKIVIGGGMENPFSTHNIFLMRLNPDGSFDPEFGTGGVSIIDLPTNADQLWDIAVAEGGEIFGAGSVAGAGGQQLAVFKFRGSPEPPGPVLTQGDVDCSGKVDAVDGLKELRYVASLPVSKPDTCPEIGAEVASIWGDVDCSEEVTVVDALKILRYEAALPVSQPDGCPKIGEPES